MEKPNNSEYYTHSHNPFDMDQVGSRFFWGIVFSLKRELFLTAVAKTSDPLLKCVGL
jgi:hypothetical protein